MTRAFAWEYPFAVWLAVVAAMLAWALAALQSRHAPATPGGRAALLFLTFAFGCMFAQDVWSCMARPGAVPTAELLYRYGASK